ncbi:MAG: hypothetical protein R2764_07440 [Bacteroidales bacterium]
MKTKILSLLFMMFLTVGTLIAQMPPHPNGGGGPGGGNIPVGGAASIGGGILILISLAIGYGARKIYDIRKNRNEEMV